MSTTSPVTSFEAAASFPCSCSCATASGEIAKAATNVATTATFKIPGFFLVKLNMDQISADLQRGQCTEVDRPLRGRCYTNAACRLKLASSRDCSIHLLAALDQICELLEEI